MGSVRTVALLFAVIAALLAGPPAALEVLSWPAVGRYTVHTYKDWAWAGQVLVFMSVVAAVGAIAFLTTLFLGTGAATTMAWIAMRSNPAVIALGVLLAVAGGIAFLANKGAGL